MGTDTTRERILAAASDVFEAKGFDKTTVRDICSRADVNVAAVNYHFGDKQNLFYKVLTHWMDDYVLSSGIQEAVRTAETPEEKLRAYITSELSYMCRANDPNGTQLRRARLLLHELTADNHNPAVFCPHEKLEETLLIPIIRDLVGTEDPEVIKHASIASTSMSTHYFLMALDDPEFAIQTLEQLDFIADFLTSFALGGLNAIKENYNAQESD